MDLSRLVLTGLIGLIGLALGSFFNVLIWRLPRGESVVSPPSHCPGCGHTIRSWENIPVLSYFLLGRRCSGCKAAISFRYPAIELITSLTAMVFWLLYFEKIFSVNVISAITMSVMLLSILIIIPVTLIDIHHYIIPDAITLTGLLTGILLSFLPGGITPLQSFFGIVAGGGLLLSIGWIGTILFKKEDTMGGGDIKLMAFIGAIWGFKVALMSIMLGAIAGSIIGIVLLIFRKLDQNHRIPFGPYLGAGMWIAILFGETLLKAYLTMVGLTATP